MEEVFVHTVTSLERVRQQTGGSTRMNLKRIAAVLSKELREIVRDKLFATLSFVLPTFTMLLLGFCLSLDVENIPIAIVDR